MRLLALLLLVCTTTAHAGPGDCAWTGCDIGLTPLDMTRPSDPDGAARYDRELAQFLLARGQLDEAEAVAVQLEDEVKGRDGEVLALRLIALARDQRGDYTGALSAVQLAVAKAGTPTPPDLRNQLGLVALHAGDLDTAEPIFTEQVADATDPATKCIAQSNLAQVPYGRGDRDRADALFDAAIAEAQQWQDRTHEENARYCLFELRLRRQWLDVDRGRIDAALATSRDGLDQIEQYYAADMPYLESAVLLASQYKLRSELDRALALDAVAGRDDTARLAMEAILRTKGRVLDELAGRMRAVHKDPRPDLAARLANLSKLRAELGRRALAASVDVVALAALAKKADTAELELLSGIGGPDYDALLAAPPHVRLPEVQAAVPGDAALVEIATFRPYVPNARGDRDRWGPPRYVAYVVRATGTPRRVDLGDVATVDAAATALQAALADRHADVRGVARTLDHLVLEPLRATLGDTHAIYLAPAGTLNLVPFDALIDERGHYAIENLAIMYVASGNDLPRLATTRPSRGAPVVIGGVAFGAGTPFTALPGTLTEAREVARHLANARLLTGADATKAAFLGVAGPSVLHVATHGFFLGTDATLETGTRGVGRRKLAHRGEVDPLLRAGLAFGGANTGADGIATALEIAGADLDGTKLVVLSACETGVGDVRAGEGVFGLRRALAIAGAETEVLTLWDVDDGATRDLMVDYYRRLAAGEGRAEALRQARLARLADPRTAHPYYWASFVASGSPQALDGHTVLPAIGRDARGCACRGGDPPAAWPVLLAVLALRRRRSPPGRGPKSCQ